MKIKGWQIIQDKCMQKGSWSHNLLVKAEFWPKSINWDKGYSVILQRAIHNENILVLNIYEPNASIS